MPHCTLEYSSNIPVTFDSRKFFSGLHEALSSFETIRIEKIKSRAVRHDDYYVGDGDPKNAFVYLHIALFEGRDVSVRREIGRRALEYLKEEFSAASKDMHCSITVEIREIERATFAKISD